MFPRLEEFKYQLKETIDVSQDEFLPTNFLKSLLLQCQVKAHNQLI